MYEPVQQRFKNPITRLTKAVIIMATYDKTMSEKTDTQPADDVQTAQDVMVEFRNVKKVFQDDDGHDVVAIEDVNLKIKDGEFLVLVGPSGCGKTTTLRSIAGLEDPTEGELLIDDENVVGLPPRERGIAMVFQNYALYPHKTVRENMAFPLEVRKFPEGEIEERVERTAETLSIDDLLDRKPSQLSGGQQQRVALGRAMVREPKVFLLDEPLSNLDAKLRTQMRTELLELQRQVEKTHIYVTHDQAEAMTLGDRVAVLNNGHIQQVAPPQELYDNPTNRFVAGFIGDPPMNFFEVELGDANGGIHVSGDFFEITIPSEGRFSNVDLETVRNPVLGIRPEDLHLPSRMNEEEVEIYDDIEAYVRVIESMGSDQFVTFTGTADEDTIGDDDNDYSARVSPDAPINEGERVRFAFNLGKAHLFDGVTGENVLYAE